MVVTLPMLDMQFDFFEIVEFDVGHVSKCWDSIVTKGKRVSTTSCCSETDNGIAPFFLLNKSSVFIVRCTEQNCLHYGKWGEA
ncbi:unnamed protein product [Calypogeia fissa]